MINVFKGRRKKKHFSSGGHSKEFVYYIQKMHNVECKCLFINLNIPPPRSIETIYQRYFNVLPQMKLKGYNISPPPLPRCVLP